MIKPINNVSFKARLKVDITDDYLDKLENSPNASSSSARLLQGIKLLEKTAPMIGTDEDVLTLSNKVPEGRLYFYGTRDALLLSLNEQDYYNVEGVNYFSNIQKSVKEIFSKLVDDLGIRTRYVHSDDVSKTMRQIKRSNTEA